MNVQQTHPDGTSNHTEMLEAWAYFVVQRIRSTKKPLKAQLYYLALQWYLLDVENHCLKCVGCSEVLTPDEKIYFEDMAYVGAKVINHVEDGWKIFTTVMIQELKPKAGRAAA